MGSKRDQRAQRKRAKAKKSRAVASAARKARRPSATDGTVDASSWPVGECLLSTNWHEQGPRVLGVFSRSSAAGQTVAMFFVADLETQGLISVETLGPMTDSQVLGETSRRATGLAEPVAVDDPDRVAKVFAVACQLGTGSVSSAALDSAQTLVGENDGSACDDEILIGFALPEASPRRSLLSRLFGG